MRFLLYFILLVITGCTYSSAQLTKKLDHAQELMKNDPKGAFEQLNTLDVAEFKDSATMARWALLYSEAMAANNLTAPTDTIIGIAIDYYGSHNFTSEYQHAAKLKELLKNADTNDALASALYIQKEKEFMLYKERAKREQYIYIGVIILVIALAVILRQRQTLKIKELHTEALMAEAATLKAEMLRSESECYSLATKLTSTINNRFNLIDELCETYYESQGTKTERKAIADKVKTQIESLKTDNGLFIEMEKSVNDCHQDLLKKLKQEWQEIKPDDYRLMVYLGCRLSSRTIALLIGEDINVVYKRKSRLKARINAASMQNLPLFLSIF